MAQQLPEGVFDALTPWGKATHMELPKEEPTTGGEWLKYYQAMFLRAKSIKAEQVEEDLWDVWREAYNNKYGADAISVNEVYANAKVIIPTASYRRPRVILTPHNDPRLWFHAKVQERIDNWLIDKLQLGPLTKALALDTYITGRAFVKFGFSSEYQHGSKAAPKKLRQFDYNNLVENGMPWILRVNPKDIWVICSGDWNACRFVFHRVYRPYEDVMKDPRYTHVRDIDIPSTNDEVELIEVWDKKRRKYAVIVDNYQEFLVKPRPFVWFPFESMAWNPDGTNFWCQSDVGQFWPQQLELNRAREQIRRHALMALIKILVRKNAIDEENLDKFFSNKEGIHVEVKGHEPLNDIVKQFTTTIPQEIFLHERECKGDIRSILGHNENIQGAYVPKSRVTAAETEEVGAGTDLRLSDRRDAMRDLVERLIKKLHVIIQICWKDAPGGNTAFVKTPAGEQAIVSWSMADLRDIIEDVEISIEDRPDTSKEQEKQELLAILQVMAQNPNADPIQLQKMWQEYAGRKPLPVARQGGEITGNGSGMENAGPQVPQM